MKKLSTILLIYLLSLSFLHTPSLYGAPTDKVDTNLNAATYKLLKSQTPVAIDVDKEASFTPIKVYFDGKAIPLTSRPFTYKSRIYLPLREVGEILGVEIGWDTPNKVAIVETSTHRIEMPQGYRTAVSFQKSTPKTADTVSIDQTSIKVRTILYTEKTYLPIRFTAEALGFHVKYEESSASVYFTTP
ncbi:MAG: copper amine oxidase N-terminal domain-containing protein [Candidatus Niameybacter stercoravium]|nr:copper amine oxidase N-terminal domain-containing protein [Candidatus Niameybacter stercoravium]